MNLLAHSAQPKKGIPEQPYQEHIIGVFQRAQANVEEMLIYARAALLKIIRDIVLWAACFHDLGKLDEENQEVLRGEKKAKRLPVNHVDAGVAYLKEKEKKIEAALLILSHHKPGLPSFPKERDREFPFRSADIKQKIDISLDKYLSLHQSQVSLKLNNLKQELLPSGLSRRLALSCLVDADYSDTARYVKPNYLTRWEERLNKLDEYVRKAYEENEKNKRNELRNQIFFACRNRTTDNPIYYCDSPVGTGKTTAVMAHLIQAAIHKELRHIIVVLPFTNIITQSVKIYRQALVLDGEDPESIVVEHDHQADFSSFEARELAVLWNAPIIVTTAVQFFETLGNNEPARLRKLHELPGTGIFIDESHAAIPTWLWPQAWLWLRELTEEWGCHLVLASGTTAKFWEIEGFINHQEQIPELIPEELRERVRDYEQKRVKLNVTSNLTELSSIMTFNNTDDLIDFIITKKGPRLVIMNTVFSAAFLANKMKNRGLDVIHLSTALTPKDRAPIIEEIYKRLEKDMTTRKLKYLQDWTLVATSCAEAGLNFSFRNGFAELRSVQSYLQINGRVSRDGEYPDSEMWCFSINDPNIKIHPGFKTSQKVFKQLLESNLFDKLTITELITETMMRELKEDYNEKTETIQKCERNHQYPEVADTCKIINSDTRLVVMDPKVVKMLENGIKISSIQLIKNSVQIWATKINELGLVPIYGCQEMYRWFDNGYDPEFLGYMKAILEYDLFKKMEVLII
jgi:CRISPR-associated endonuclease/helicase Cas3